MFIGRRVLDISRVILQLELITGTSPTRPDTFIEEKDPRYIQNNHDFEIQKCCRVNSLIYWWDLGILSTSLFWRYIWKLIIMQRQPLWLRKMPRPFYSLLSFSSLLRSSEHFERTPLPQFRVAITFETINKRSFKIIIIIQYSGKQARIWHFLIEIPLFGARIVPPTIPFTRRHCVTELLLSWLKTVTFGLQCLLWNQHFPNSALLSMI